MGKKVRAISTMMAVLITIAIVVFAGMMLWYMTAGFFKGGGKAALTVSGTGSGSSNGQRATLNLVIQNTGDGAARIMGIYIQPESSGVDITDVTAPALPKDVEVTDLASDTVPTVPTTSQGGEYLDLDAKSTTTVFLQITGQGGLFAGSQIRVYVVYYDLGSGQSAVADTVVTLR